MRLIITIREGRRAICPSWLHFGVLGKRHEFALFCRSFLIRLGRPRTIVLVLREMSLKIFFKGKHLLVDFLNSATEKEWRENHLSLSKHIFGYIFMGRKQGIIKLLLLLLFWIAEKRFYCFLKQGRRERKPLKPHFTFILLLLLSFFRRGKTFENWRQRKQHRRQNAFFHSKVFLLIWNKVSCRHTSFVIFFCGTNVVFWRNLKETSWTVVLLRHLASVRRADFKNTGPLSCFWSPHWWDKSKLKI